MKKIANLRHFIIVNMPYLLLKVLIEHNALTSYISNVISYYQSWNKDEIYDSIETVFDTNQIGILLADSFFWEESKEGYEFWFNIYKEIRSLRI